MKTQRRLILVIAMMLWIVAPAAVTLANNPGADALAANLSAAAELPLTVAQQDRKIKLTVIVKDVEGNPVVGASVNAWHDTWGPDVRDYDYKAETNADGIATIEVTSGKATGEGWLFAPRVYVEVRKNDVQEKVLVKLTKAHEKLEITAKPRDSATGVALVYVKVRVKRENDLAVEGAAVKIEGYASPRNHVGLTGPDGSVTIPVTRYSDTYYITASKQGYSQPQGKTEIRLFRENEGKTIDSPTLKLKKEAGALVTVTVTNAKDQSHVSGAKIVLNGKASITSGLYYGTTDGSGQARIFTRDYGRFEVEISQEYFETYKGEVSLSYGDEQASFDFTLKEKPKKEVPSNTVELTVVASDGKNTPIAGALVTVGKDTGGTDAAGKVTVQTSLGEDSYVAVTASASGYKTATKTLPVRRGAIYTNASASGTIVLEPTEKEIGYSLEVTVLSAGEKSEGSLPLQGAIVTAGAETATTDANGQAKLTSTFEGSVEVAVEKSGYLRQSKSIRALGGKGSATFTLQAEPVEDSVSIMVMGQDTKGGSPSPIAGADVSANGLTAKTDNAGRAAITGNFKGGVEVIAKAKGFDSQTQQVSITQPARTGSANFLLLPEALPLRLIVEVRDAAAPNNQVAGAHVDVGLPVEGTPALAKEATDSRGEATFELKGSADQLSKIRSGLRLSVSFETKTLGHAKIAYFSKPSDITAALLEPSNEARRVTVYLERDWSFLREDIPSLQGRISSLNNDAREAVAKSQSVLDLAAKSPAARGRAESALNELKQAHATFLRARVLSLKSCEEANQIKESILSFQKEAGEKRKQLKMALDEALTLAATCTTSANADRISSGYKNAIRLVGEIGALGPKAMDANQKLSRYAAATRDAGALKRLLQQTRDNIETELAAAKKNAGTADADYHRALELSAGLRDRRSRIQSDLVALNAEYEATKNYSSVPPDLAKQLDGLAQQLGAYNNDVSFGRQPGSNRLDVVRETVAAIEEYKSQADSMAGDISADMCDVQPMDDAVEEIRTLVTNSSFELGLAADLPNKAAECAKRGACMPVIDEVRALLRAGALDSAEAKLNQARAQGCDLSALPGGASLVEELDYYKSLNEAVALLKTAQSNCKFQEALDWAARLPESIRSQPSIAHTLIQVRSGLDAQQRVQRLRVSARDAVTRGGTVTAAEPLIRQAQQIAGPYPCLVEEVNNLGREIGNSAGTKPSEGAVDKPVVEEIPEEAITTTDSTTASKTQGGFWDTTKEKAGKGTKPPVVEEIPDDNSTNVATNRTGSNSRPPVVEEIPETASTNVASNPPRANSPQVEEIPETSTGNRTGSNRGTDNPPPTTRSGENKLPPNVVRTNDGKLLPKDGYVWANPNDPKDLRVKKKPRDPNKPDFWTQLGGAIREGITGQPPPGNQGDNTGSGGNTGGGGGLNLAGTWSVTTQMTGDDEMGQSGTRTNVWHVWDLGGGRWRVRQVINGQTYDEVYSTVDYGGGSFRLITTFMGDTHEASGTYNQSQFQVTSSKGQSRVTITGARQ